MLPSTMELKQTVGQILTYDDNGNCISQELYDSEDRVIMRSEYVYVYREVSRRHMQRVNEGQEFLKSTNI